MVGVFREAKNISNSNALMNRLIDRGPGTDSDTSNSVSETAVVLTTFRVASDFERDADRYLIKMFCFSVQFGFDYTRNDCFVLYVKQ